MHEHNRIIEELGGEEIVAERLASIALNPPNAEAVRKWRRNGIPWYARAAVGKLARKHRIRLPIGFDGLQERQQDAA